jgi:hypothetical protein
LLDEGPVLLDLDEGLIVLGAVPLLRLALVILLLRWRRYDARRHMSSSNINGDAILMRRSKATLRTAHEARRP